MMFASTLNYFDIPIKPVEGQVYTAVSAVFNIRMNSLTPAIKKTDKNRGFTEFFFPWVLYQ